MNTQEESRPIETLLNILHYDTRKRLEVLREEIEHLIHSIGYRITGEDPSPAPRVPGPRKQAQPTSQAAFLSRLQQSAKVLLSECTADLVEANQLKERTPKNRGTATRQSMPAGSSSADSEALKRQYRLEILWNAKIINKALVIAERLGDLHDKLEQFLQRTNPEQPDPTLRRRSEQGLADKYLSEKTRWVHKDLACLVRDLRANNYPLKEVPSTYQFWAYNHTSHHHAFISLKAHDHWARKVEAQVAMSADARPPATPASADATESNTSEVEGDDIDKQRFVCLSTVVLGPGPNRSSSYHWPRTRARSPSSDVWTPTQCPAR